MTLDEATWDTLIPLIAILPLAGFGITALIGRRLRKQAHWIPVLAVVASWVIAMAVVVQRPDRAGPSASTATATRCSPGSRPATSWSTSASSSTT